MALTAQKASFFSEQSSIATQYKEDEHVRITFVTEKRTEHRLLYCFRRLRLSQRTFKRSAFLQPFRQPQKRKLGRHLERREIQKMAFLQSQREV